MQTSAEASDVITQLVPGGSANLSHLSDTELLNNTRILVGKSNQVFAALLAHLAEVDARGLHRTRACASLYTYCIYELRFSEDAAARRAGAAKLVKRFPLLLDAIANGELHLTGLLMLGPHLTAENVVEVLGRAKFRTKKELAKLVRELHPLPLVPDSIEPLGIAPKALRRPTWEQYVTSLAPAVRELPAGERPRDWANDTTEEELSLVIGAGLSQPSGAQHEVAVGDAVHGSVVDGPMVDGPMVDGPMVDGPMVDGPMVDGSKVPPPPVGRASALPAPARVDVWRPRPRPLAPQQYQMQFTTTEEHVQLVDRAKALLARSAPGKSLGELHLQAMKLLVQQLKKRRFAVTARPPRQATMGNPTEGLRESDGTDRESKNLRESAPEPERNCEGRPKAEGESHRESNGDRDREDLRESAPEPGRNSDARPKAEVGSDDERNGEREGDSETEDLLGRQGLREIIHEVVSARGPGPENSVHDVDGLEGVPSAPRRSRRIPAAVRRTVFERDGGCCTFVDERGVRCRETRGLELHHRQPFGRQGTHAATNVTLHCHAHNALAAERDFGAAHMARHREALRHETMVAELRAANPLSHETD